MFHNKRSALLKKEIIFFIIEIINEFFKLQAA